MITDGEGFYENDPVRQQIVALLIDKESMYVSQIAEHIPMSRPTVSYHINILKQAGLLQVQKKEQRCTTVCWRLLDSTKPNRQNPVRLTS